MHSVIIAVGKKDLYRPPVDHDGGWPELGGQGLPLQHRDPGAVRRVSG